MIHVHLLERFLAQGMTDIDALANQLISIRTDLEEEDKVTGLLGVHMEGDPIIRLFELKQTCSVDHLLETLGLQAGFH